MRLALLTLLCLPAAFGADELDLPEDFKANPDRPDVPLSFSATRKFFKEKSGIQAKYRSRLADALQHADGAEILLLSFTPVEKVPDGKEDDFFSIAPYKTFSQILQRKKLAADQIAECRKAVVELLRVEKDYDGGAACHFPIHAVRLYRGKEIIFQTSFCWKCDNYFIEYPDDFGTATWVGFSKPGVQTFLNKEMPIPKSEIDRFEAEWGDKSGKAEKAQPNPPTPRDNPK